jgi:predicted XRE-type DNA-binding protein
VFHDLGFGAADAQNLRLRSQLMMRIHKFHSETKMTQGKSAKLLGVTQRHLNELLSGRLTQFDLDALVKIATRAGLSIRLVVKNAHSKAYTLPTPAECQLPSPASATAPSRPD